MYYYFSSGYPAIIKLNGIYYGQITDTVKQINVLDEQSFIEVCSLTPNEKGLNFILNPEFIKNPPTTVSITDLKGGYLIKFLPTHSKEDFSLIEQKRFNDAVVSVFCENGFKLSIETQSDFYAETLRYHIESAEIERKDFNGASLVFVRLKGVNQVVNAYRIDGKIQKLFSKDCVSIEFGDYILITENYLDIAKHQVSSKWKFNGESFELVERSIKRKDGFAPSLIPSPLLPFAFLEELLCGGEINDYIAENIIEHKDKLSGFFGEFIGVMPPPLFREQNQVGLIYKESENKFFVRYFTFSISNGKINNFTEV